MRSRLRVLALVLLTAAACSREESSRQPSRTDTTADVSTHEMSVGLTRDEQQAERDLTALQDSIYLYLGDSASAPLREARVRWEQYRKIECDALRIAFAEGTMAPIAQLECLIALTDERRHFLDEQYDFLLPTPPKPAAPTRPRGP